MASTSDLGQCFPQKQEGVESGARALHGDFILVFCTFPTLFGRTNHTERKRGVPGALTTPVMPTATALHILPHRGKISMERNTHPVPFGSQNFSAPPGDWNDHKVHFGKEYFNLKHNQFLKNPLFSMKHGPSGMA